MFFFFRHFFVFYKTLFFAAMKSSIGPVMLSSREGLGSTSFAITVNSKVAVNKRPMWDGAAL